MSASFIITLLVTVVITTLIVLGLNRVDRNKKLNPALYKQRSTIRTILYILLNLSDLFR